MGLTVGLDVQDNIEISFPCWDWNPGESACSQNTMATKSHPYKMHIFYGYGRAICEGEL